MDNIPVIDPDREDVQCPKMRPSISTRFGTRLTMVDGRGKRLVFALEEHDLAHLALSIISAQERLQNARLEDLNRTIPVP